MKNLRTLLGLVVLLVTLAAPAWAGDMPTPPAPEPSPTPVESASSESTTAEADGDMPTPPLSEIALETLGIMLSLF